MNEFFLPKFDLKFELSDRTVSDDVKNVFNSSDTILLFLIKADKISAPSNLRENLFAQGEKLKNLSKEMQ